jgi:hypothetical protein
MSNTRNGMAARKKLFAAGLQAIEFAASHILKLGHFLCHDFSLKETVTFVQFLAQVDSRQPVAHTGRSARGKFSQFRWQPFLPRRRRPSLACSCTLPSGSPRQRHRRQFAGRRRLWKPCILLGTYIHNPERK